jgi:hypothetical protein
MCAFDILEDGAQEPKISKRIPCHMIFDIKMDFIPKAHFVAGGHVTDPPSSLTYSSFVAWDSVCLAFLIAALNNLEVLGGDIGNVYLQAPTKEKVHTICSPKFGHHLQGFAIICRALYGLKSSGAAWHSSFAGTHNDLGFTSSLADPDCLDVTSQQTQWYSLLWICFHLCWWPVSYITFALKDFTGH